MSYTTLAFIIFILTVVLIYYLMPFKQYQWVVLLAASYVFYLFTGYKYAVFILFTTFSTYLAAVQIEKISLRSKAVLKEKKAEWNREQKKAHKKKIQGQMKLLLVLALVANLGILGFLKYYNFLAGGLNDVLGLAGFDAAAPMFKLFLPLGISFYTFQSLGYLIDVYRGNITAEKNPAKFALFISFFPQIIQGPISAYDQLARQLYESHRLEFRRVKFGAELILWGYFKKMVIADRAVTAINTVTGDYTRFNGTTITFIVLLYAFQLYADFSAGIDISRGIAEILGIDMVDNFRRPYFSKSINEYWRRWHITLGAWMKNYLFYPLAMSGLFLNASKKMRKTKFGSTKFGTHVSKVLPTCFASLIVFLMVGLWHGANSKYVAFGLWNGMIIMLSTLLKPLFDRITGTLKINTKSFVYGLFQMFRTFLVVLVGYVFDIAPDFGGAMDMMRRSVCDQHFMAGFHQIDEGVGLITTDYLVLCFGLVVMFTVSVIQEKHNTMRLREMLNRKSFLIQWFFITCCIIAILVFGQYGPGYDPAEFVYMQF